MEGTRKRIHSRKVNNSLGQIIPHPNNPAGEEVTSGVLTRNVERLQLQRMTPRAIILVDGKEIGKAQVNLSSTEHQQKIRTLTARGKSLQT